MDDPTTRPGSTLAGIFDDLLQRILDETVRVYGSNLTSLVVFGSVGRGTPTPGSDIDVLLIAGSLPSGMLRQVGVEPPEVHDVGDLIVEYRGMFSGEVAAQTAVNAARLSIPVPAH